MRTLLLLIATALFLSSCGSSSNKFDLDLKEENPYVLTINKFTYRQIEGSTDVVGEFDELNHIVIGKLKGRTGVCEVYLNTDAPYYLGFINLTKDKDWKVFNDRGGIRAMLQRHLSFDARKRELDTIAVQPVDSPVTILPDTASQSSVND